LHTDIDGTMVMNQSTFYNEPILKISSQNGDFPQQHGVDEIGSEDISVNIPLIKGESHSVPGEIVPASEMVQA
jgi:hypothetical protein